MEEEIEILIVGGGICGLATALALHRKNIKSVVLERSDTLRATGAAIGVFRNGWRALHQLGVDSALQLTSIPIQKAIDVWTEKGVVRESIISEGDARCLRRSDLVEALANSLPTDTIRFGCQVVSINVESSTSSSVLQLHNGSLIKAKVLIGCDGANSVVANYIGLSPARSYSKCAVRGLTTYSNGHGYAPEFLRVRKDGHLFGRIPINENMVYWFVVRQWTQTDGEMPKDLACIKQMTLDMKVGFPSKDIIEMIENCDLSSLSFTRLRYRSPWNLLYGKFRKEKVTVAGDAWHVMGPFIGQGGSAALEDAIVLARCLSKKITNVDSNEGRMHLSRQNVVEVLDAYLKERRRRVLLLSILTYVRGLLLVEDPSFILKLLCIIITTIFFGDQLNHIRYDCGEL